MNSIISKALVFLQKESVNERMKAPGISGNFCSNKNEYEQNQVIVSVRQIRMTWDVEM